MKVTVGKFYWVTVRLIVGLGLLFGVACTTAAPAGDVVDAQSSRAHGVTRINSASQLVAWNADSKSWVTPVAFWRDWADNHGGLRWGQGREYPPYAEVEERDLFLVEVESGVCLMEFWHRRWRRAQDVRRWSEAFNKFGGCPDVFR